MTVDNLIHNIFNNEIIELVMQLSIAILCGGIIGIERGIKGMAAGFRTHILVCLGATLVMITNIYIYEQINTVGDPTRIATQVVSGIGFLGAGTILVTAENRIKGLTTAAGLWASACMGLAIGVKYYTLAILGCLSVFLIMTLFNKVDKHFYTSVKIARLELQFEKLAQIEEFIQYIEIEGANIENLQIEESVKNGDLVSSISCKMTVTLPEHLKYAQIIKQAQNFNIN